MPTITVPACSSWFTPPVPAPHGPTWGFRHGRTGSNLDSGVRARPPLMAPAWPFGTFCLGMGSTRESGSRAASVLSPGMALAAGNGS